MRRLSLYISVAPISTDRGDVSAHNYWSSQASSLASILGGKPPDILWVGLVISAMRRPYDLHAASRFYLTADGGTLVARGNGKGEDRLQLMFVAATSFRERSDNCRDARENGSEDQRLTVAVYATVVVMRNAMTYTTRAAARTNIPIG